MSDDKVVWPSALVASALILMLGGISVAAIIRYPVEDALKVFAAFGTITGLFTGVFVTYFFTRGAVESANVKAKKAEQRAAETSNALVATAAGLHPDQFEEIVRRFPAVENLVRPPR